MFILSVRASTLRFFSVAALAATVLTLALIFGGGGAVSASGSGEIRFSGRSSREEQIAFLQGFGIEVKETPTMEEKITMPENFDRVIAGYNEIQKSMGLDLSKYTKKRITKVTYEVTNGKESDGLLYATLLLYRGNVVGCDVSSADPSGFVIAPTDFSAG